MKVTVWKNEQSRVRLEAWFDRFLSQVPGPVEHREIPTRHGLNHVLIAGPPAGPPIVCLHAMRTSSAHLLSELGPLLERYRIVAPDLPGQSVRGLQVRLSLQDDSYARWLLDVLDGLELPQTNLFGVSWGGFVAQLAASTVPDRFQRLGLLVPAGIVNGSHWKALTHMALPLIRYRLRPSERTLRGLLDPLLTTWDERWAGFMGDSMTDMVMDLRIPPLASDAALRRLTMPTLVLSAADDLSFPGEPLVRRIKELVPHAEGEVIPACKHCPPTTNEFRRWLANRLTAFYETSQAA